MGEKLNITSYIKWVNRSSCGLRTSLAVSAFAGVVRAVASIIFVWVCKQLVDVATGENEGSLIIYIGILVGTMLLQIIFSTIAEHIEIDAEAKLKNRLRHRLFSHIMESRWQDNALHTGDMINRIFSDIETIGETICRVLPSTLVTCLQFAMAFVFLAMLDWRLAIVMVLIMPLFLLLSKRYMVRMRRYTSDIRSADSHVQTLVQEYMQNRVLLSTMEYTPHATASLEEMHDDLHRKIMRRAGFTLYSRRMVQTGFSLGYIVAFLWGVYGLREGAITFGVMTAFLQLVGQIQRPIFDMSRHLPSFIHLTTAVDRLQELADLPLEQRGEQRLAGSVGVRMEKLHFAYRDDEPVIEAFSHDFTPGSMTAILGHTGAGKSTLIRIILGLVEPQQGSATIYNAKQSLPLAASTRCNIAYVPQGNSMVSGSVRSNLMLGNPDASEEQLREVLRMAVADFVFELPLGLDTPCGEDGVGLSEGQAQRIAIARGLLRERNLLILDEPTAALDPQTEQQLMANLAEYARQRTMIIVTHREATAELCDGVVYIK